MVTGGKLTGIGGRLAEADQDRQASSYFVRRLDIASVAHSYPLIQVCPSRIPPLLGRPGPNFATVTEVEFSHG